MLDTATDTSPRPSGAAIAFTLTAVAVLFGLGFSRLMHAVNEGAPVMRAAERLQRSDRLVRMDQAWDPAWSLAALEDVPWLDKSPGAIPVASLNPQNGVTVVNLWASWCEPCRAELPAMMQLARAVPGAQFVFVGYDEDWKAPESLFRELFGAMPSGVAVARDPLGQAGGEQSPDTFWRRLGATGIPETFFVKNGRILGKVVGAIDWRAPEVVEFVTLLAAP